MPDQEFPDSGTLYDKLTALESRLRQSIEDKFREVKEMFATQQARQDELARTLATRSEVNEIRTQVAKLEAQLQDHTQLEGHSGELGRLIEVEKDIVQMQGRPLKVWQVVTTAVVGLLYIGSLILSLLSYLHSLH